MVRPRGCGGVGGGSDFFIGSRGSPGNAGSTWESQFFFFLLSRELVFSRSRGTTPVLFGFVLVYCRQTKIRGRNAPCFNIR
jgi:hypothetical protein